MEHILHIPHSAPVEGVLQGAGDGAVANLICSSLTIRFLAMSGSAKGMYAFVPSCTLGGMKVPGSYNQ